MSNYIKYFDPIKRFKGFANSHESVVLISNEIKDSAILGAYEVVKNSIFSVFYDKKKKRVKVIIPIKDKSLAEIGMELDSIEKSLPKIEANRMFENLKTFAKDTPFSLADFPRN